AADPVKTVPAVRLETLATPVAASKPGPRTVLAHRPRSRRRATMVAMTSPHQYDCRHLRVWVGDGPVDDPYGPAISPVDHGLVAGDGVFEALKVTDAGPFGLRRHLERLTRSARALGLPDPDHGLVREAVAAVTEGRQYRLGKIRITWTGGPGPLGSQ